MSQHLKTKYYHCFFEESYPKSIEYFVSLFPTFFKIMQDVCWTSASRLPIRDRWRIKESEITLITCCRLPEMLPQDWTLVRALLMSEWSVSVNIMFCVRICLVFLLSGQPLVYHVRSDTLFTLFTCLHWLRAAECWICMRHWRTSVFTLLRCTALDCTYTLNSNELQMLCLVDSDVLLPHWRCAASSDTTCHRRWPNVSGCSLKTVKGISMRRQCFCITDCFSSSAWTHWVRLLSYRLLYICIRHTENNVDHHVLRHRNMFAQLHQGPRIKIALLCMGAWKAWLQHPRATFISNFKLHVNDIVNEE